MTMRLGKFLVINFGYWLLASVIMVIDGWSRARQHFDVAIVRCFYLLLVGILVSMALSAFYNSPSFQRARWRAGWLALVSFLAGLLTALLLNPITYMMVGYNIHNVPHEILSTGTLYFILIYLIWSVLYLQLSGRPILYPDAPPPEAREAQVFQVEKLGERRLLQDSEICCITAKGDYVELVTATNSYLIKDTLTNLERRLDSRRFRRVHRSTIVNRDKVDSVVRKPGGVYDIALDGGHTVTSSRSYKAVVEDILPDA